MIVMTRGKSLIGAVLVLGIVGVALSACAPAGPEGAYANGYYDYSGYYDPGYFNEFGFVGPDLNHDGPHRHDRDGDHDRDPDARDPSANQVCSAPPPGTTSTTLHPRP